MLNGKTKLLRAPFLFAAVQFFAGVAMGGLLLATLTAGIIYQYQDSVDGVNLPEVDAIVCLAGGRGRIAAAGDLWYRYHEQTPNGRKTPLLFLSGLGPLSTWKVVNLQVRPGVLTALKASDVILETQSTDTIENASTLIPFIKERKWKRILLVTSRYHMRRAQLIFSKTLQHSGLPVGIETLSVYQEPFEPGEWRTSFHGTRVTLTEYFKLLYFEFLWDPS